MFTWPLARLDLLHVEVSSQLDDDAAKGHSGELIASADECREEDRIGWGTEHISMHLLPPVLITNVTLLRGGGRRREGRVSIPLCDT